MSQGHKSIPAITLVAAFIIALIFSFPPARAGAAQGDARKDSPAAAALDTATSRAQLIDRLSALIPRLMTQGDVPGLSIAVIRNAEVLWQHPFGVKNADT